MIVKLVKIQKPDNSIFTFLGSFLADHRKLGWCGTCLDGCNRIVTIGMLVYWNEYSK